MCFWITCSPGTRCRRLCGGAFASPAGEDETWVFWAVALGGGAGLRAAGRVLGWSAPGRFQHLFVRAAATAADPLAAAVRAEVARLGGDAAIARRVLAVPFYRIDPTAIPGDRRAAAKRAFWTAAVGWLASRGAVLCDADARDVLAWAAGRFAREGFGRFSPGGAGGFVWRGRGAAACVAAVAAERARLAEAARAAAERETAARREARRAARARRDAEHRAAAPSHRPAPPPDAWPGRGWDRAWRSRGAAWAVRELTTARALAAEGAALGRCAAGYAARCGAGDSAVFGLTMDGARRATVELDPRSRRVVQLRGPANRPPTPEEAAAVDRWRRVAVPPAPAVRVVRRHGGR